MSARTPSSTAAERTTPESFLRRLDWHVLQRLDGRLQGDYRTRFLGDGLDVADLRDYQPDDDVRRIDWNVTARMDSPFVRQYDEDRDLSAWFLVDRSASMKFGHDERTKEVVTSEIVVALARVLTNRGNRVGAMLWNNSIEALLEPRTGRTTVLRLAKQLLEPTDDTGSLTTLTPMLTAAAGVIRRRSLVFVISDFLSDPGWDVALRRLATRHDVVAIRVIDPQEIALPNAGLVVVQDAETGEQMTVDTANPRFRQRFIDASTKREAAISDAAARAGVDLYDLSTEDDLARALLAMITKRKGRSRR